MRHLGDITKINGYEVPITDVVVGGSPCQDLSVAGKRAGLDGEKSGLFMEQIRLVKEMRDADRRNRGTDVDIRPRYMLWENVPGAFSSNKGEDFRVVLEEVARVAEEGVSIPGPAKGKWNNSGVILGDSYSIAWRVFDAQYWGVPQRRRRICLVADFNGHSAAEIVFNEDKQHRSTNRTNANTSFGNIGNECRSEVQPICESLSGNPEQSNEKREELAEDVRRSTETGYPAFTYQDREGKPGGGKGGLIQEDKATSLRTNNYMTVFQPMVLESNQNHATITQSGVCPTLNASMGLGGGYVPMITQPVTLYQREFGGKVTENAETSPTLEAAMGMGGNNQPIVVYSGNGNELGNVSGCITGDHENRITDFTNVLVQSYGFDPGATRDVGVAFYEETSKTLANGTCPGHHAGVVVAMDRASFNQGINANYDIGIDEDGVSHTLVAKGPGAVCYEDKPNILTSSHTQFFMNVTEGVAGTLSATDYKEPPMVAYWDGTQTAGTLTANNADGSQRMPDKDNFNCVIEKYPELQDTTGSLMASGYDKLGTQEASNGMYVVAKENVHYIVRRLTPLECERLQGYPDGWTDIGEWTDDKGKIHKQADSARYKALGNSIALPSWRWVMKRMAAQYERPATLASLFDGIGGFPLIWESINGKGTCLWASEIEDFPMAVTKRRFK